MLKQRELAAQTIRITVLTTYVGKTKLEIWKNSFCKIAYFPAHSLLASVGGVGTCLAWVTWVS